jgi:ubiquitin C-terminal hydrolase
MGCWHCKRTAVGVCRFCGRGICEDHVHTRTFILDIFDSSGEPRALVVEDALHCGACHPRPDPVALPELKG